MDEGDNEDYELFTNGDERCPAVEEVMKGGERVGTGKGLVRVEEEPFEVVVDPGCGLDVCKNTL